MASDTEQRMSTSAPPVPQLSLEGTANLGVSARPPNIHRGTTATVVNQSKGNDVANPGEETAIWKRIATDIALLLLILIMILWPWVFFGVVQAKHGIQMYGRLADIIEQYPQKVGAVVTFLGTIIRLIATYLFGKMIVRFGQELIAASLDQKVTVFGVSALLGFRHSSMVWGIGQWRQMQNGRGRWAILVLLLGCLGAFALVPTGIAGLITPGQFNKTANLIGTELNFASTDPECIAWLEEHRVPDDCDWKILSGTQFTTCLGENQMLDVLDSGRAHMLSVINRTETSSLAQLGAEGGIRFLGSAKGVLPIGPDGVLAFNTLENVSNPFSDDGIRRRMVSYNYTLTQQGLESVVRCFHDEPSPIRAEPIDVDPLAIIYSTGTCDPAAGLESFLPLPRYITRNTQNTLMYWACKQTPQSVSSDPTYFFYLRGRGNYAESIGNITCQISPIHAHNYQVEYLSRSRYFTAQTATGIAQASLPQQFSRYLERAIQALGDIVSEGQNGSANLVAEAVFSLAAKKLYLSTREWDPLYLQLYEAMIQGMLEYEITYSRLVYNVVAALNETAQPPPTCTRRVDGQVSYAVRGWYIQDAATQAGLLIPMTLINLASFSLLIACFVLGKFKYRYNFDATDNIALLAAVVPEEERPKPDEIQWSNKVNYPQTQSKQQA